MEETTVICESSFVQKEIHFIAQKSKNHFCSVSNCIHCMGILTVNHLSMKHNQFSIIIDLITSFMLFLSLKHFADKQYALYLNKKIFTLFQITT